MKLKTWIKARSSSSNERKNALNVAANFLDREITGSEGESNNIPVAQFNGGEIVLSSGDTFITETKQPTRGLQAPTWRNPE